ncbi:MAG TPA: hypothetical protein VMB72_08215 [Acidimicrobiales bacterium]|nr:hypothetical protein [Acidimicrobiales bacterium]
MDPGARSSPPPFANPSAWPPEVLEVFHRSITVEYASLTRSGTPVTIPTTPYVGADARTLDISTGLTYPAKAERARREPRVCLLFADPVGSGMADLPVVLVQGLATVRDADLQANTDRYLRLSQEKLPEVAKRTPAFAVRAMAWYFVRIWVEVTPLHMRWWPSRALEGPPSVWNAPEGTAAPLSDPAPSGAQPGAWVTPPASWRAVADEAAGRLGLHDLTVTDANGFPLCLPVLRSELVADGFRLWLGPGAPALGPGPACLTMHAHPEVFTGQENRTLVGELDQGGRAGEAVHFRAERALADWSIAGSAPRAMLGFLAKRRRLGPRLAAEAKRRSQPVPTVRVPPR